MARSNPTASASEMLGNLKAKLGFSQEGRESVSRYGSLDEDFDDEGYSARLDDEFAGYGSDYDENAPIGAYRPATIRPSRFGRPDSAPNLVSIDDVKANTPVPDSLLRDPLDIGFESRSPRRTSDRSLVEGASPAVSSPAYNAALRESRTRSEGLNSLFEPSGTSGALDGRASGSSYDPYVAYSSSRPSGHVPLRSLTVIRPVSYDDVERVAKAVKAGDVVVLALRNASDELAKRILDFSFGVASALDANVECPASKVFAIARGGGLSDEEKRELRTKGVL